jgi:uncharacterized protein with PIN domain
MASTDSLRFVCDAMLGGLARWLRAAGYDACWRSDIGDWDLIRLAIREGRLLLSSDSGIFKIGVVRDGEIPAFFVPRGLDVQQQLGLILARFHLAILEPRCMACGGALLEIPKEQAQDRAPERSFEWADRFWECDRCRRLFWQGTHWQRISEKLRSASEALAQRDVAHHPGPDFLSPI